MNSLLEAGFSDVWLSSTQVFLVLLTIIVPKVISNFRVGCDHIFYSTRKKCSDTKNTQNNHSEIDNLTKLTLKNCSDISNYSFSNIQVLNNIRKTKLSVFTIRNVMLLLLYII